MNGMEFRVPLRVIVLALPAYATHAGAEEALPSASPAAPASAAPAPRAASAAPAPARVADSPHDTAGQVVRRVFAEALMGTGLATVGFLLGPELTGAQCRRCLYAGAFAAANVGFPLGVYWGGVIGDGDGSFWLTAAGPWVVAATGVTTLALDADYDGEPAYTIGVVGGAVAAPLSILIYELTSAYRRSASERQVADWRPRVAVTPYRDGMTLHVGGEL